MSRQLRWGPDGAPRSLRFDDIYYHPQRGAEESAFNFLGGCGLPEAWRRGEGLVIGETGFGTGLNFLVTLDAWSRSRPPGRRLHYVSVEGFPLDRSELVRAHAAFPRLAPASRRLLEVYPEDLDPGFHRLHLPAEGVVLDLLIGEVAEVLSELEGEIQAWYLDGFAPARNPEMWRREVLVEIARLSGLHTRLATFTAAGAVRRGLEHVGFAVHRAAGFEAKRERIVARFDGPTRPSALPAWARVFIGGEAPELRGDGIAAQCLHHALRCRGVEHHWAGRGERRGSDVPVALVMPRFTADDSLPGRFYAAAFRHARRHYAQLGIWGRTGALLVARSTSDVLRYQRIGERTAGTAFVPAQEATDLSGLPVSAPSLHVREAGFIEPDRLPRPTPAAPSPDRSPIVWATGLGSRLVLDQRLLPLTGYRGQVSLVASRGLLASQRCAVVAGHYLSPAIDGRHMIGATFDRVPDETMAHEVRAADHERNVASVSKALNLDPALLDVVGGWAGTRAALPDRLPAVGPAPDAAAFIERFGGLRSGRESEPLARPVTTLVLTGLGARGYTVAPLAGELLASQLLREPWPVPRSVALALWPARFLVRALKRRQL